MTPALSKAVRDFLLPVGFKPICPMYPYVVIWGYPTTFR